MKAAVVRSFDAPPRYEDFDIPRGSGSEEIVVEVLAAGLHPRVRSGAAGLHYADKRVLPMIPGIDAVGRLANGELVYCVAHDTPYGTMAERVVVDRRRCISLPEKADPAVVAAAMNPAMSSWLALRLRAPIEQGQSVFVLGATGNAGRLAVPVAKLLGAGRVVGAGREIGRLESSEADEVVSLVGEPASVAASIAKAAADCDIVLDYVWGKPALDAMTAILTARPDHSKPLRWVQIGSVAGPTMELPSVALRSTALTLMGSGQGSVSGRAIVAELPHLVDEIVSARFEIDVVRAPLSRVEQVWTATVPAGRRVVLMPGLKEEGP
jgi:NADPH:quinone reductase-like Zn-dependent oxidoreductase